MSEKSIAQAQLKQLKTKLDASINSRAALEEDFNKQSTMLIDFISKLSMTCKGLDLELDNRLAKLRSLLTKSAPLADIENEIKKISVLLTRHTGRNEKNIRDLHTQFHHAGSALQKINGMPPQARRSLRALLSDNNDSKDALVQYVPKLSELLSLYNDVLKAKHDITAFSDTDSAKVESAGETDLSAYVSQIVKLVDSLSLSDKQQKEINLIKPEFVASAPSDSILSNIVKIFNVIIKDMEQERQTAKAFLSTLSGALSKVQRAVKSTIISSEESKTFHNTVNESLGRHLSELVEIVESSDSLVKVKSALNEKLEHVAQTIEAKSLKEIEYYENLEQNLQTMQLKVEELEAQSISFEKRLQEQQKRSMQDALTKLNNRASFDDYIAKEMVRFHHSPSELAIVVIDLDDFKRINDTYGHTAGDKTLQVIASTLKKILADSAFIARYGGEEFVLVFNDLNEAKLISTLNRLRKKVALLPFKFKNNKVSISTSIGATHVKKGDNVHLAFERADQALYQAKNNGKNQVIYF